MKRLPFAQFIFYCSIFFSFFIACNHKDPKTNANYQPTFSSDSTEKNTLLLGFPSLSYSETAELLMKYLNAHLTEGRVKVKACITYDEYLDDLKNNKFDITFANGILGLELENRGYSIVGKITDDSMYTGVIFTKKDPGIKKVTDLKGKRIAIIPYRTVIGTMMPLYYLYQHGLDVNHDIIRVDVSSSESAIIATYIGKTDAGICLTRNWEVYIKMHPEILSKVDAKWITPPLINNALLIKKGIDSSLIAQLMAAFFSIKTTSEGKAALDELGISGFEKADSDTYKPMLAFKRKYEAVIH